MRRSSSIAILAVCFVLLGGTVLATAGSIAVGAWQPVWDRPDPTPGPGGPGPGPDGPGPGPIFDGEATYDEFLDEVRAGRVIEVRHDVADEEFLFAQTENAGFQVVLPDEGLDVYADVEAAAAEGGVAVPRFYLNGVPRAIGDRTYAEFLDDVRLGRVFFATTAGDQLSYETEVGHFAVPGAPGPEDVLRDMRAAAAEGGVQPPGFNWNPA